MRLASMLQIWSAPTIALTHPCLPACLPPASQVVASLEVCEGSACCEAVWDPLSDAYLLALASSGAMALWDVEQKQQVGGTSAWGGGGGWGCCIVAQDVHVAALVRAQQQWQQVETGAECMSHSWQG